MVKYTCINSCATFYLAVQKLVLIVLDVCVMYSDIITVNVFMNVTNK